MESRLSSAAGLAARSVHVVMRPTARTLAERREVLKMLERHGEVVVFRPLKYHPSTPHPETFLAIYLEPTSVQELLQHSPLQYQMLPVDTAGATRDADPLSMYRATPSRAPRSFRSPIPEPTISTATRTFTLTCNASSFDHMRYIRDPKLNPLYGPYLPELRSAFSAQLECYFPNVLWASGLADWETDSMRRRKWVEMEETTAGADIFRGPSAGGTSNGRSTTALHRLVGTVDEHARRIQWAGVLRSKNEGNRATPMLPLRLQRRAMREREREQVDSRPVVMKGLQRLWQAQ